MMLDDKEVSDVPIISKYHTTIYRKHQCATGDEVHGDNVQFHGLAMQYTV